MTKLTESIRQQIMGMKGDKTTKGIADQFGVSQSTIRRVFREQGEAETKEATSNQVKTAKPPASKTKAEKRAEVVAKDTIPTISLGAWNTDEPGSSGDGGAKVSFADQGQEDLENVETDDLGELDDFEEQWNEGEEDKRSNEEAEEEAEEEEEIKMPTKRDQKKFREFQQMENDILNDALNPQVKIDGAQMTKGQAELVAEDVEIRSKFLSRIYLNVINFRELLPFIKDKDKFLQGLHKKTTKELISLSGLIETQRSLGNVAGQMKNAFFIFAKGTEFGCSRLGMKVDGFADDLRQKERELEMIFQEIAVEQADNLKSYTTPQMRLAMIFTSSLMLTDSRNRVMGLGSMASPNQAKAKHDNAPVSPDLKQQFSDL